MTCPILLSACCCEGTNEPLNAVVLTAYVSIFDMAKSVHTLSNPTNPSVFPGGHEDEWPAPPCTLPEFELPCNPDCIRDDTTAYTQILCPNGVDLDAPRRWGTSTVRNYHRDLIWFNDDPLVLPFLELNTDTPGIDLYMVPVGGGAAVIVSSGVALQTEEVFEDTLTLYPAGHAADPECMSQLEEAPQNRILTATWQRRMTWNTPPMAMQILADAGGTSIEVTASQIILTTSGPATHTYTLGTGTMQDVWNFLNTWCTPYSYTGAGTLPANMAPHPDSLLVPMANTTVPTSGTKVQLWIANIGDEIRLPGDHDGAVAPFWKLEERHAGDGSSISVVTVPLSSFLGSERAFRSGCRADYNDAWQEALYDSGDFYGVANIYPTYGTLFGAPLVCKFTTPSGAGVRRWCSPEVVTNEVGPYWEQDPGDCWVACEAARSKSRHGDDLLWQIQRA